MFVARAVKFKGATVMFSPVNNYNNYDHILCAQFPVVIGPPISALSVRGLIKVSAIVSLNPGAARTLCNPGPQYYRGRSVEHILGIKKYR